MKAFTVVIGILLSLGLINAQAAFNTYQFEDTVKQERFDKLINELRCTVCQNQTIADSNASLAKDLRDKVYKMVKEGQSEQQIKDFMVARFTDFVLYNPPVKKSTYLLWTGPFILLGLGIVFLITYIRKRTQAPTITIDEHEHQRIQAMLKEEQKDQHND
jgi:cytochrome c-type biogenesis protein CcmH